MSNHASINTHTHAPNIQRHKVQPSATKCNYHAPSPLAAHNHQFKLWDTRAVVGRVLGGTPVGSKTPYSLLLGRLWTNVPPHPAPLTPPLHTGLIGCGMFDIQGHYQVGAGGE